VKKVINNDELKNKMCIAVNMLCGTVKTTLGPRGNNVIINNSSFNPFITNDGVTIAENIESDDNVINTILKLTKEASINTDEVVGDGTTTTLVLLESIFNEGMNLINKGINPIVLKNELDNSLNNIIDALKKESIKPNKKDLLNIATTSSNSDYIGKIITDTYLKVKNINSISIKEYNIKETKVVYNKGYIFESNLANTYYFKDQNEIILKDAYIILSYNYIDSLNSFGDIINDLLNNKKDLVIICKDYSEEVINQVISLYIDNTIKIYLFKTPEYGINELIFLDDISVITNAKKYDDYKIGIIKNMKFDKEKATILFNKNNRINELIKKIKNDKNPIDKDFNNKRLSMLTNSLAEIQVGGNSMLERRELVMRYVDALHAINSAKNGILLGSGIPFYKISNSMICNTNAEKILKNSLSKPIHQILINSGIDYKNILDYIKNNNYNILYNVKTYNYENINNRTIIDPLDVSINSLTNAVSIAGMLLTTSNLVMNEFDNTINKINEI